MKNKSVEIGIVNRDQIPGLRRASGFVAWFLGTAAPKLNPKGFHACINCKYSDHVGGYCGLYHAEVTQIETCDSWQVKKINRHNATSSIAHVFPVNQQFLVDQFNSRNAKATIRETYSKRAAKQFKKSEGIFFKDLTQRQRDIIIRELTNEYMFDDDIYGTVREYYEGLRYQFIKIAPEKLPMSAWEYIEPGSSDAEDIEKHFERQTKIENSIIKDGYNDDYPITVGYSWHENDNAHLISIAYGNHRIQAVRNLMAIGRLPPDFKIPVMVIFDDPVLRARIRRKEQTLRRQELKKARTNAIKVWPMSGKWRYSNRAVQQFDILANIEEKHPTKKIPKGQTSLTELSQKYTLEYKRKIARKIKNHFAWAARRLSTTYTPKISEIFTQARPYDQWPPEVQAIIMNQLKSEGEGVALMVDKDVYGFGMFTEAELAGSYWEERARDFVDKYIGSGKKFFANQDAMEAMPRHYNKIIQIEKMIKERGYDPAQPLMIECFPQGGKDPASFFQMGGHHRLQAIRNLIKAGNLPKDFQFPVLCTFQKDRWGLESESEHWKRQSEVKKKWFDAHPGKRDFPGDW
jgi:hypothetical protein